MTVAKETPDWMDNLLGVIKKHIEHRTYIFSHHALEEMKNDHLSLPDIECVLIYGRHAKEKTTFSTKYQVWNYAIEGKAIDGQEVRVIVAFEDHMLVVTVFVQGKIKRKR